MQNLRNSFAISGFFGHFLQNCLIFFSGVEQVDPQVMFFRRFEQNVFNVNKCLRDKRLGGHNLKTPQMYTPAIDYIKRLKPG